MIIMIMKIKDDGNDDEVHECKMATETWVFHSEAL